MNRKHYHEYVLAFTPSFYEEEPDPRIFSDPRLRNLSLEKLNGFGPSGRNRPYIVICLIDSSIATSQIECDVSGKVLPCLTFCPLPGFRGLNNISLDIVSYRNDTFDKEDIFPPKMLEHFKARLSIPFTLHLFCISLRLVKILMYSS